MRSPFYLLLVACLAFPACDLIWGTGGSSEPLTFRSLDEAAYLSADSAGTVVFNDAASWRAFWREHGAWSDSTNTDSLAHAPAVDFSRRTAVGMFWSPRSGCDNLVEAVEEVVRTAPHVAEVEIGPLPDLGDCEALVYPVQVITFEKSRRVDFSGMLPD